MVEALDGVLADDLRLHLAALLGAGLGCGAGLAWQRQLDAAVGEHVVAYSTRKSYDSLTPAFIRRPSGLTTTMAIAS